MKLTLQSSSLFLVTAIVFALTPARADIVTMKDGKTKYEGKILEETADIIKIEYHLTPKIKDTKTLQKADVLNVKKQTPAEIEFEERGLGKLLPAADMMSASDYEGIIQDKLRPFVSRFPGTPQVAEVEKIITALNEEKARVLAGEMKMEGKWLSAAAVKRDAYDIAAYTLRQQMKAAAAAPNDMRYVIALRHFEQIRTRYPASLQYVEVIPEAIGHLNLYEKQLTTMIQAQPKLLAQREAGIKGLTGSEATVTKNAIKKELAAYNAAVASQVKSKTTVWYDIYPYDLVGLKAAQTTVIKTRAELEKIDLEQLRADNTNYIAVIRAIAEGNISAADAAISRIPKTASGSQPAIVISLRKQLDELRKKEATVKKLAIKEGMVETSATPGDPKATADAANPLAEDLKKLEEKKRLEKEAAKKKKDEEDRKKAELDALNKAPEEEEGFISQYGMYLGGVLVLVLGGAFFFMKKRKSDED